MTNFSYIFPGQKEKDAIATAKETENFLKTLLLSSKGSENNICMNPEAIYYAA